MNELIILLLLSAGLVPYGLVYIGQAALLWRAARQQPGEQDIHAFIARLRPPLTVIYAGTIGHLLFMRGISGTALADELREMASGGHPLARLTPYALAAWGAFPILLMSLMLLHTLTLPGVDGVARVGCLLLLVAIGFGVLRALGFGRRLSAALPR